MGSDGRRPERWRPRRWQVVMEGGGPHEEEEERRAEGERRGWGCFVSVLSLFYIVLAQTLCAHDTLQENKTIRADQQILDSQAGIWATWTKVDQVGRLWGYEAEAGPVKAELGLPDWCWSSHTGLGTTWLIMDEWGRSWDYLDDYLIQDQLRWSWQNVDNCRPVRKKVRLPDWSWTS